LPTQLSFLSVIPEWIPVSAVKPANDASGAIVRLYNPTSSPTWVRLASYVPVARAEVVDFNEHRVNQQYIMRGQRAEGFPTATDALHLELQPKKIVTVKLYYW
jgi:alpha-mannosidase